MPATDDNGKVRNFPPPRPLRSGASASATLSSCQKAANACPIGTVNFGGASSVHSPAPQNGEQIAGNAMGKCPRFLNGFLRQHKKKIMLCLKKLYTIRLPVRPTLHSLWDLWSFDLLSFLRLRFRPPLAPYGAEVQMPDLLLRLQCRDARVRDLTSSDMKATPAH